MDLNLKICTIGYRKVLYVFLALNTIGIACMIATFAVPRWSSFEAEGSDISKNFKGKVLETTELYDDKDNQYFITIYHNCQEGSCNY